MIDTLGIRISPDQFVCRPTAHELYCRQEKLRNGPTMTTLHTRYTQGGSVVISFSVPQALFGSSLLEYGEMDSKALLNCIIQLFQELGIEVKDVGALQIFRLDLCRNLTMPRPATHYVIQAARYSPPRTKVLHMAGESATICWNRSLSLTFYDKERQARKKKRGYVLRIELQIKRAVLVRQIMHINDLNGVLGLEEYMANHILKNRIKSVLEDSEIPEAPDAEVLWSAAAKGKVRGTAALFTSYYLSYLTEVSPEDISSMREQMRDNLSRKSYYLETRNILQRVATAPMDAVFRRDVLDRIC